MVRSNQRGRTTICPVRRGHVRRRWWHWRVVSRLGEDVVDLLVGIEDPGHIAGLDRIVVEPLCLGMSVMREGNFGFWGEFNERRRRGYPNEGGTGL